MKSFQFYRKYRNKDYLLYQKPKTNKVTGELLKVVYKAGDFGILKIADSSFPVPVTVKGVFADIEQNSKYVGLEYEFEGRWVYDKNYKWQFEADKHRLITDAVYFFLCHFIKGIGPKTAKRILDALGVSGAKSVLYAKDKDALLAINGIGPKTVEKIFNSFEEFKSLQELTEYLYSHGANLSQTLVYRIYRHYEHDALKVVQEDPYRISEMPQVGFKTADALALSLGVQYDGLERLKTAALYVLNQITYDDGSSFVDRSKLLSAVTELVSSETVMRFLSEKRDFALKYIESQGLKLKYEKAVDEYIDFTVIKSISEEKIDAALNVLESSGEIEKLEELDAYGLKYVLDTERDILNMIKSLQSSPRKPFMTRADFESFIYFYQKREGIKFSEGQKQFLEKVALSSSKALFLVGYAGSGKTTLARAMIELLKSVYPSDLITGTAFTGMAAERFRQVTGHQSKTIHSLLRITPNKTHYNFKNPLPHRVVILDEASMVDAFLFRKLLKAIHPDALFIAIGDTAQLMPVGVGAVFVDLINQGLVDSVFLTSIFRQSEDSVLTYFANQIRKAKVPKDVYDSGYKDFYAEVVEKWSGKAIYAMKRRVEKKEAKAVELQQMRQENNEVILKRLVSRLVQLKRRTPDLSRKAQVLSPMKKGILGTEALNATLQDIFNPSSPNKPEVKIKSSTLRLCDKVVHLMNIDLETMNADEWRRRKVFYDDAYSSPRVYNGSVGYVVQIDEADQEFLVEYADQRVVKYAFSDFKSLVDHAFALTVHKSQGSQYEHVFLVMSNSHWMMLNNKWLYTALTRAEKFSHVLCQLSAFERACKNVDTTKRLTWLSLQNGKDKNGKDKDS